MKKIGMEEYMGMIRSDPAARRRVEACRDPARALETIRSMAGEQGYELKDAPSGKQALADDDLEIVAGGRNPFLQEGGGELNPYSWFVTLLRTLFGKDDEEFQVPGNGGSGGNNGVLPRR